MRSRAWVQIAAATMSGNSLRQTIHTHRAFAQQTVKLVAALLRDARVTAGLAESNGSLPPGLWLTSPAGWLPRIGNGSGTLRSVIEYGLRLRFFIVISDVGVNRPVLTELLQSQTLRHYQAASHALHITSNATARPLRAYMALRPKIHRKLSNLILDERQAQR